MKPLHAYKTDIFQETLSHTDGTGLEISTVCRIPSDLIGHCDKALFDDTSIPAYTASIKGDYSVNTVRICMYSI